MDEVAQGPALKVIAGGNQLARANGEQILRDAAGVMSDYLTQRLAEVAETDPLREQIQDLAVQHRALAG